VDGDPLIATLVRGVSQGSLTLVSSGAYTYEPVADYFGSDSFSYKINDGLAESASVEVAISVRPVNDAPVANGIDYSTPEDTALEIDAANGLLANDYDIDSPFIGLFAVDEPQHGELELFTDGHFSYQPDANFVGSDWLTYRAFDGLLISDIVRVNLFVSAVNDPPNAEPDDYRMAEDGVLLGTSVLANDSDIEGSALSASLHAQPSHGQLELGSDGSFRYVPVANFAGNDSFRYLANDGRANSAATLVSIVVDAENDLPVILPFSLTTNEDTRIDFFAQTSDPDGDVVTVDRSSYTPPADFHGVDSFAIIADDGQATSSFTVQVTVLPVNDAPVIQAFSLTTNEDTAIDFVAQTSDVDGDAVSVSRSRYEPADDFHGVDSFVIIADDGQATSSFTVQVTVLPVNDPPVITPFSLTTDEDTPSHFTAQTSDIDGDLITVDRNSYTPAADFHGSDSFVIIATDGQATSSFTVQVTVLPVNDPPVITPFSLTTDEDTPIDFCVETSDIDGDSVSIDRNRYEPPADFNGSDSFAIIADDGQTTSSFTVQVIVLPVNDPPVITPFSLTTDEDTPVDFAAQTSEIDGDIVTVTHTRYTPPAAFHGSDSFAISASDGTTTSSLTVTVLVNPVNDPPINTRSPAIDGLTIPGNTLTVDPGLWADIDGDNISFSYVWRRDGTTIATSATYHVTDSDPSHVFSVEVTADDDQVTVTNSTAPIAIGWQVTVGNLVFGMGDGPKSSDSRISIIAPWRPVADSATWVLHSDSDVDFALNWATTPLPEDRFLSCYEVVAPDDLTPAGASATRIVDNGVLQIPAGERWFAIRFDAVLSEVLVFRHGWNLCSFPIQPLAAPAFGPLWCELGGEMQRADIPDAMRGYWVWRARPGTALVHGIPAPSVITVAHGPNTIGVDRTVTPAWNLNGPINGWQHGHFRETSILQPRRGYLIYSDQHQTLSW
jgi:hypothetical protein